MTPAQKAAIDRKRAESFDPEYVHDLAVEVYKMLLEDRSGGGPGAVARMLENDKDDGKKLSGRAVIYDDPVRACLKLLRTRGQLKEPAP